MPYRVLVQGCTPNEGCFVTYWYRGHDINLAVHEAVAATERAGRLRDVRIASIHFDSSDEIPDGFQATDTVNLLVHDVRHGWPLSVEDGDFAFPAGVAPAPEARDAFDPDDITEGTSAGDESDYLWLEAVIDGRRLEDCLHSLVDALPVVDGFEVRLFGHWEDAGRTEVWVAGPDLVGDAIWEYVASHPNEFIRNGFVEIAFYARGYDSILRLTEHKTLVFTTTKVEQREAMRAALVDLGIEAVEPYRSVAHECTHYHYRPADARDRESLRGMLDAAGFRQVDAFPDSAP